MELKKECHLLIVRENFRAQVKEREPVKKCFNGRRWKLLVSRTKIGVMVLKVTCLNKRTNYRSSNETEVCDEAGLRKPKDYEDSLWYSVCTYPMLLGCLTDGSYIRILLLATQRIVMLKMLLFCVSKGLYESPPGHNGTDADLHVKSPKEDCLRRKEVWTVISRNKSEGKQWSYGSSEEKHRKKSGKLRVFHRKWDFLCTRTWIVRREALSFGPKGHGRMRVRRRSYNRIVELSAGGVI